MPRRSIRIFCHRQAGQVLLLGLIGMLCCSCSGGAVSRKTVYPAKGKVLFEGRPILGALVRLHPLNDSSRDAPRPAARSAADGTFELSTYAANDGAPEGSYAVTVSLSQGGEEDDRPKKIPLPERYAQPDTTDLRAEIKAGNNDLPLFQLKK